MYEYMAKNVFCSRGKTRLFSFTILPEKMAQYPQHRRLDGLQQPNSARWTEITKSLTVIKPQSLQPPTSVRAPHTRNLVPGWSHRFTTRHTSPCALLGIEPAHTIHNLRHHWAVTAHKNVGSRWVGGPISKATTHIIFISRVNVSFLQMKWIQHALTGYESLLADSCSLSGQSFHNLPINSWGW